MARNDIDKKKYSQWQVAQIRLTYFSNQVDESVASKWWETTIGEPSEQKTIIQKQNMYQEQGKYSNGKLVLSNTLNRIDWIYLPNEGEYYIGPFTDSMEIFSSLMLKWFEISPQMNRLAIGLLLHLPVKSKKAGYKFIAKLLPSVRIDVDNSSDFLYQINRPRKTTTGVDDLSINRLMKWSVALIKKFAVSPQGVDFVDAGENSVRLELDMNTAAEYNGVFPRDKHNMLYAELVSLAKEILIYGDKP